MKWVRSRFLLVIAIVCLTLTFLAIVLLPPELSSPIRDIIMTVFLALLWVDVFQVYVRKQAKEAFNDRMQTILLFAACNFLVLVASLLLLAYHILSLFSLEHYIRGTPMLIGAGIAAGINFILILTFFIRRSRLRRAYEATLSPAVSP